MNIDTSQEKIDPMNHLSLQNIEALKAQTKISILDTFYRDESVLWKVFSIITGKKINPSELVNHLETVRLTYKSRDLENDDLYKKAA